VEQNVLLPWVMKLVFSRLYALVVMSAAFFHATVAPSARPEQQSRREKADT
jgi:hypothetical protein